MDYQTLKQKDKDGFEQKIYDIINHKIGAEFCQNCKTIFHVVEGQEIAVVQIKPTKEPAFLKQNDDPIYYVRMGNSTRKLSVKEVIKNIELRKK